ncbi:MAG TPA: hypothetical protein VE690_11205 [Rhodopila sp.]|nr:hypothetical protein [Rhodopila sp.]
MVLPTSFAELDELLLERVFQPVADFLAWHGGWSRGAAAGFCVDVAAVAWIAARAPGISAAGMSAAGHGAVDSPVLAAGLLGVGLIALVSLRILFRKAASGRHGNPLRRAMRPHRGVALLLLLVRLAELWMPHPGAGVGGEGVWADAADVVTLLFSAGALYLGACAEPPPVRRRRAKVLMPARG